jgi:hypothetical protein
MRGKLLGAALALTLAAGPAAAEPFTFVAMGDMPYRLPDDDGRFERLRGRFERLRLPPAHRAREPPGRREGRLTPAPPPPAVAAARACGQAAPSRGRGGRGDAC